MYKKCMKCNMDKNISEFYKRSDKKDKLSSYCKKCKKIYSAEYYKKNRNYIKKNVKKYYKDNKELLNKKSRIRNKLWRLKNLEYKKQYNKKWVKDNLDHEREYRRIYNKNKRKLNINFKLRTTLRNRLNSSLKNNAKRGSAVRDLGCSIEELKKYLESKFQHGMTWENYGKHGWHIDHVIPLSSFDLADREQFLKACHYTNLQPLWAEENYSKGNRVI